MDGDVSSDCEVCEQSRSSSVELLEPAEKRRRRRTAGATELPQGHPVVVAVVADVDQPLTAQQEVDSSPLADRSENFVLPPRPASGRWLIGLLLISWTFCYGTGELDGIKSLVEFVSSRSRADTANVVGLIKWVIEDKLFFNECVLSLCVWEKVR